MTRPAARAAVATFAAAAFLGAALLFLVQPLVARLVLPSYGGSPAVWTTSMLFFQTLLIVGYLYAHVTTRRLGPRRQPRWHLAALLLPVVALPLALPAATAPPAGTEPALWLLRVLLLAVGLPFVLLATTGPLLQRWFSWLDHPRAGDPYFLYAASNLGSVVGLLGYPFLLEPRLTLSAQTAAWSAAYAVLLVLVAGCAVLTLRRGGTAATGAGQLPAAVGWSRRLRWAALSFLPSSLMLGVTTFVSTDIAAIPLFWVVPLAAYLLTFVVAFAGGGRTPPLLATTVAAVLAVPAFVTVLDRGLLPVWATVALHLALLLSAGLAAHGRLAADRPAPGRLTEFYLVVSIGGALGGLANGLLAPALLDRVVEYPLAVAAVPLLLVGVLVPATRPTRVLPTAPTLGTLAVLLLAAGLGGVAAAPAESRRGADVVAQERTFFGSYRVAQAGPRRSLVHGTTLHGWEDPGGEPTSYYARSGPLGDVFAAYDGPLLGAVGAVGLGVGTVAAYGRPGQRIVFHEIDPEVVALAREHFGFLANSPAEVSVVVGDGRLTLADTAPGSYGLVVLDAFSSDAIPVHLLTVEALRVYGEALRPGGVLAVHVSNRHLELEPVLAAAAAKLGWFGLVRSDPGEGASASASAWVALGREGGDLAPLAARSGWDELCDTRARVWTDDYSSVLEVLDPA